MALPSFSEVSRRTAATVRYSMACDAVAAAMDAYRTDKCASNRFALAVAQRAFAEAKAERIKLRPQPDKQSG